MCFCVFVVSWKHGKSIIATDEVLCFFWISFEPLILLETGGIANLALQGSSGSGIARIVKSLVLSVFVFHSQELHILSFILGIPVSKSYRLTFFIWHTSQTALELHRIARIMKSLMLTVFVLHSQVLHILSFIFGIPNQLTNLTDLMTKFVNANTASTSNSGTLPSNTIANLRSDLKAITTRSGVSYDGPQTPPPPSFLPTVVENEPEATKDTVNPTNNGNTKDVQPQAVHHKPVTSPISEPTITQV
nr:reverse transcriptase domain-containing protein [Tanacetum cinerariifolium]